MKKLVFSILFSVFSLAVFAQDDEKAGSTACQAPDNEEAKKNYEKSQDRKKYTFEERKEFLGKAIQEEPTWAEANLAYAKMIMVKAKAEGREGQYPLAIPYLKAAVDNCPEIGAEPFYQLGVQYYLLEDYKNAIPYLEKYVNYDTDDATKLGKEYAFFSEQANEMLSWSRFYVNVKSNPHPYSPSPVKGICTQQSEYLAIITPDNTMAFYVRQQPVSQIDRVWASMEYAEVFTQSDRQTSGDFTNGERLDNPFNLNRNEGAASFTIDNRHLFYTIAKETPDGLNTDIYTSDFIDGVWTEARSVGDRVNDPIWWDSQPCVSPDGTILYFASNRPGGKGGIDIWYTKKGPDGEWGVPMNMGAPINTEFDEKSPFLHADSQTLYFASNGHPGLGGYDIFFAHKNEKGVWQNPTNLGVPINTEQDEVGLFVSSDGTTAFFCSNNSLPGRIGGWDVYQFELYKEARPDAVVIVKGELKDDHGNPVTGPVTVEAKNVVTKEKIKAVVDTTTGQYAIAVKVTKKEDYVITIKKDSAAFNSTMFTTKQEFKTVAVPVKPIEVKKLKVGTAYTIHDINFASNSAVIEPESMVVLEEFAAYLKEHPTVKIEIHGHTDNVGDDGKNMALSNERAYAVYEALTVKFGVPRSQITASKGYGETRPLETNDTELGRTINRRTEFLLVAE
jgi:outer membrane protein OmpA-like peptidoglycan-associated protein/tetratricopeptide (TPR) repeat protein